MAYLNSLKRNTLIQMKSNLLNRIAQFGAVLLGLFLFQHGPKASQQEKKTHKTPTAFIEHQGTPFAVFISQMCCDILVHEQ